MNAQTINTLDLAGLTAMTSRLCTCHVTPHDEGAKTTILEIDNSDRALPMPEDGETYEVFLDDPALALVTFAAIGGSGPRTGADAISVERRSCPAAWLAAAKASGTPLPRTGP